MSDATVAEVLNFKEVLLVQFAVEKRIGIERARKLLQDVPGQTLLRNATKAEPLALSEVAIATYDEYEDWLSRLSRRFSFDSPAMSNWRAARSTQQEYGFGLETRPERDPWNGITVGCVRQVARSIAEIREEAVRRARMALSSRTYRKYQMIEDEELDTYIALRRLHRGGVIGDIAQPAARILGLAMSTDPKSTRLARATWPGVQFRWEGFPQAGSTWREILEKVTEDVRRAKEAGVPTLVVLDCALGWPCKMGAAIAAHAAGNALPKLRGIERRRIGREYVDKHENTMGIDENGPRVRLAHGESQIEKEADWRDERNLFFRRATETHVRECLRAHTRQHLSKPYGPFGLDVGADKSARTTHLALRFIGKLREELGEPFPVVTTWCGPISQSAIIEVTTVEASRLARKWAEDLRKRRERNQDIDAKEDERDKSMRWQHEWELRYRRNLMLRAASAFLNGELTTPRDVHVEDEVARKEGWIWWQDTEQFDRFSPTPEDMLLSD